MEEKYTLEVIVIKFLEKPDGTRDRQCHQAIIESNGLSLKDTQDMQNELAPVILGWLKQDEPQSGPPATP